MFHKRLLAEFSDNQKYVAGMVFTQWVSLLANALLVYTISLFLEAAWLGQLTGLKIAFLTLAAIVAVLLRAVMTSQNSNLSFLASTKVKGRLRDALYHKFLELGAGYRSAISTAEAVQISTEGVEQLEIYFGKYMPQFFYSLLAPVTLFILVGTMSIKVAAVLFICVPLIPVSIIVVQKAAKKLLNRYWGVYTGLGDSFLECLQALTTLKIYQAEKRFAKKMDDEAEQFRKITMNVLMMQLNSISVMDFVAYGGAALGILLSIFELKAHHVTFVQCFFIIMISAEFFLPLRLLGSFFHIAMNGMAAADKIFGLLDAPEKTKGNLKNIKNKNIFVKSVTFSYKTGIYLLDEITFQIKANRFTALVGTSGSGKSTIVSLLMKEQLGYKGQIFVGEHDLLDITEEALYQKITRIGHDSYLFQGSLEDNLRMGKEDAGAEEMEEVLRQVDLYETVRRKGGLSMQIEERAANLSGGQRQRIALARAILHDSDIYLLDEATSNIDAESEDRIMQVVHRLAETKTIFLISHRLANVVQADHILFLENGRITEQGSHRELIAQEGSYCSLFESQRELEEYAGRTNKKEAV